MKTEITETKQRDILLTAVNTAVTFLLQAEVDQFESAVWQSMGVLAEAVDADRVRLWRNHSMDGKLYCTQMYEWSEGAKPSQGTKIAVNVSYDDDLPGWKETLTKNKCINSIVSEMPETGRKRFVAQGILSLLIVPVFLRNEFWGFLGFNDCHHERLFTSNEESILRSAALLITNALMRNEMTQELTSALDKASAANRAKSQFLSSMSHEIRTPINAIVGMTTIGKSAPGIEKKDYAFEKIEIASAHLLGVINDVLDMSKIEANKFDLSNVVFDFETMIKKVVNVIAFRIQEKKIIFKLKLDPDIPKKLIGDDQRLAQIITNLLSNAVKFTPKEGSVSLFVHCIHNENTACTLQFKVTDTGIGISQDQQKRLFNSFEQAENDTTRKYGGTGLGLAISKRIVELMDGDIWVESELGAGASFIFTVNLGYAEDTECPSVFSVFIEKKDSLRILVADDDPDTLEFFEILARQIGVLCDTAIGSREALELLNRNIPYDLCFIDLNMPVMDGIELAATITAMWDIKPVIIIISAQDWNMAEKDAKEAGISGFLSKPLFTSDVAECISNYTGLKTSTGQDGAKLEVDPHGEFSKQALSFKGRRILLAEDVDINREIVLTLLEPAQIAIDCAVNGAEAVRLFKDAPHLYDLIFMDVQMPEIDGLEATRQIRAFENELNEKNLHKQIPIIAMTANVFKEDVEKCLEAGMNDHIGKPIDYKEILAKMKQYLNRR